MPERDASRDPSIVPETPCPICGKPRVPTYAPFCSKRCADVDLHRWLTGVYRIEAKPDEDEDGGVETAPRSPDED